MTHKLLKDFIDDVRIESVKLVLQVSSPHEEIQRNPIIGNINYKELDSSTINSILAKELKTLKDLATAHDYGNPLSKLIESWNEKRMTIQAEGYGYFGEDNIRRSEAYSYVFLLRILKKRHKELHKLMKNCLKILNAKSTR